MTEERSKTPETKEETPIEVDSTTEKYAGTIGMGDLVKAARMLDYCISKNAFEEQDLDEVKKVFDNITKFNDSCLKKNNVTVDWVNEMSWHAKSSD